MELELKHLAPYLPYELKILNGKEYDIVNGIDNKTVISLFRGHLENFTTIENVKPILRPLSDLTKEIKVNGNLFTPNHHPLFKIFISADMDWFIDNCPFFVDYGQVQKLLEWHFDVFGLIELGLAIDKNTL